MKHKVLLLIIAIALCTPLKAQYEGLIIKMDFFDPTTPKEKRSIEVFEGVFTSRFVLTVSTTKTIYNRSSESVYEGVRKTTNHLRSKTTTDTIINLSKESFNEIAGEFYVAASTCLTQKTKTSSYEIIDWSHPTVTINISNGPVTMEFLLKCPVCQQDNNYEEHFRAILTKFINYGNLDSEKILGNCEQNNELE